MKTRSRTLNFTVFLLSLTEMEVATHGSWLSHETELITPQCTLERKESPSLVLFPTSHCGTSSPWTTQAGHSLLQDRSMNIQRTWVPDTLEPSFSLAYAQTITLQVCASPYCLSCCYLRSLCASQIRLLIQMSPRRTKSRNHNLR